MSNRAEDWLSQAHRDMEQAEMSRTAGHHEWACFAAQQAAEKVVKALHLSLGQETWGHVVRRLLAELPPELGVGEDLLDRARVLDGYYIPTRYPNGHPEGPPLDHYGDLQAREAIQHAHAIIDFCAHALAERRRG